MAQWLKASEFGEKIARWRTAAGIDEIVVSPDSEQMKVPDKIERERVTCTPSPGERPRLTGAATVRPRYSGMRQADAGTDAGCCPRRVKTTIRVSPPISSQTEAGIGSLTCNASGALLKSV